MNRMSVSTLAVYAILAMGQPVFAESALQDNHVVTDKNGNTVHAIGNGTCVRTKWEAGTDACGIAIAAPRTTTTTTRTTLTDDERSVYFAFDSAALNEATQQKLNAVSQRLRQADDVASAEIVGYADRLGSDAYNEKLSARRAQAVKNYLVQQGYLNVNVAQVRAMGESNPTSNCSTTTSRTSEIACLSPDRRVEIQLTYVNRERISTTR